MLQKKYALVERSYDKTKAVAFIDYVEGDDFQYGLTIFEENKIAARWPVKAVAQLFTFSKKGSDRIVQR